MHSHFTLLESTIRPKRLVEAVAAAGMDAVALTDRGNMCAAFEFHQAAKDAGITGILGCQVNVAPLGIAEKSRDMHQLVLLASSADGYRNLSKLVSRGWLEGFYYEPRVDLEILAAHAGDLVCLTGASTYGFLNRHLMVGADDEARRQAGLLAEIFPDRLFVEIADHGDEDSAALRTANLRLAADAGLPPVATNWVHYLGRDDAVPHDVLLAINKATTLDDARRRRMPSEEFHLKSPDEMAAIFADAPEAIANTRRIVELCRGCEIPMGEYHLPVFPTPGGREPIEEVERLAREGVARRYGDAAGEEVERRLAYELEVIGRSGFAAYFLIVADLIGWAKDHGIPVGPGRGSAAGSLVAYCLDVTDICPLRYGLLFERFLNPGRKSMPDIDIDFCKDGRQAVIDYAADKYGADAVTQIMTLGTMKARMAIKDVARAYGWTPEEAQELANLVPEDATGSHTIPVCLNKEPLRDGSYDPSPKMLSRYDHDERTRVCLDTAMEIEGLGRNLGVHACGVIIAPDEVADHVPVCVVKGKPATQYNMSEVEECGLLKMDFLGLKTMSILKKVADMVAERTGDRLDYPSLPLDDRRTFEVLGEGRTLGVFQCESTGFQELIKMLRPDRFEDMIALVALYRPGPLGAGMHASYCDRKHGREKVEYPHPVLEKILEETYGLYIYQEQVMEISRELCGFSPADADDLRKAMGKKKLDVLEKLKEQFLDGAEAKHGFPRSKAEQMWTNILGFASYCFNKSHSACYGLIAYWTAYMKANHYAEFMTANLVYEMGNKDKMTQFVLELRNQGIEVLPPDVNRSRWEFHYDGRAILFGFGGIKGVGAAAAEHVIAVREDGGEFASLYDFCERVDMRRVNKRVVEHLIKTGAFDSLHPNRHALLTSVEKAMARGQRIARSREQSQTTLFDAFERDDSFKSSTQGYPQVEDWPEHERLAYEKALTGYWMSSHPLREYRSLLTPHVSHTSRRLAERPDGEVRIAAVVIGKRTIKTRTGKMMAVLELEDEDGPFEAVLFAGRPDRSGTIRPGPFERFADDCESDLVALFKGTIDKRERRRAPPVPPPADGDGDEPTEANPQVEVAIEEDLPSIIVSEVIPARLLHERLTREVILNFDSRAHGPEQLRAVETAIREHGGTCPLRFQVHTPAEVLVTMSVDEHWRVHPSDDFLAAMHAILGEDYVLTVTS